MTDWKALTGRISLFPGAPASGLPSALELYKQAWGADPERFQTIPNALAPTVAQGKGSGVGLSCSVHPTRIDFNITPPPPSSGEMNLEFRLIEDTSRMLKNRVE